MPVGLLLKRNVFCLWPVLADGKLFLIFRTKISFPGCPVTSLPPLRAASQCGSLLRLKGKVTPPTPLQLFRQHSCQLAPLTLQSLSAERFSVSFPCRVSRVDCPHSGCPASADGPDRSLRPRVLRGALTLPMCGWWCRPRPMQLHL